MELDDLREVQRRCAGDFRLAARVGDCPCARRRRAWFLLGVNDYLMEEILLGAS